MPWVRIDEKAMEHPKVAGLPDGAFRLWVEGLTFCQKFLTDGFVAENSMRGLRAYSPKRRTELIASGLWEQTETGVRVHDYLQWNESREHVMRVRQLAKDRVKKLRGDRQQSSREHTPNTLRANTLGDVSCSESYPKAAESGKGDTGETTPEQRAGAFCQWYEDTHDRIVGVGYMGTQSDYQAAIRLVRKFGDQELMDAAVVWFGMNDDFATSGTRTVPKFASRVTACLERIQALQARGIA
jgi:hypothetical protein